MENDLWVDKYQPESFDDYVFMDSKLECKVGEWIDRKSIPNLLFSGVQGSGKSALVKLLVKGIGFSKGDILRMNASRENKVDDMREKVHNFAFGLPSSLEEGARRLVILNEADTLTHSAQKTLLQDIEDSYSNCRFILTCNYPNKLMPAMHSRMQHFSFKELPYKELLIRAGYILSNEDVQFELKQVETYVKAYQPDLRKIINELDKNTVDGKLQDMKEITNNLDYMLQMADLFKIGKYKQARELVVQNAQSEEYEDIYRFLYENLEYWSKGDTEKEIEAILAIRDGIYKHGLVADIEINLSATICQLQKVAGE